MSLPDDWNYCSTDENPAHVATRPVTEATSKHRLKLWLEGPEYLKNIRGTEPIAVQVKPVTATPATTTISDGGTLQHLIEAAPDWYTLKNRVRYLMAFTKYFCKKHAKNAGEKFAKPRSDAAYMDKVEKHLIAYVQRQSFGPVIRGEVLEDVLGLEDTFSSPWPWPQSLSPWLRSLQVSKMSCPRL